MTAPVLFQFMPPLLPSVYLFKTWNLWRTGKRIKSFAAPSGRIEPVTLAGPKAA